MAKSGSRLTQLQRGRRKANLSRKQVFEAHRKAWEKKKAVEDMEKKAEKRKRVEEVRKIHNKKSHKEFDHAVLHTVQDGLTAAIEALGEKVTPLAVFMSAFTAASTTDDKRQIPYLLAILSACIPKLSQGVLHHASQKIFQVTEQLIAENSSSNSLIVAKAMKLLQAFLLSLEQPNISIVASFEQLKPSNLNEEATHLYLLSFRKFLEHLCLANPTDCSSRRKDPASGYYPLTPHQLLFVEATPHFVDTCLKNMAGSPSGVISVTFRELSLLWERGLSPYMIESVEGQKMINNLISHHFLTLMKPDYQQLWGLALTLMETFFSRINYLKRVAGNAVSFTQRFPGVPFFLKVLHKLRCMNDSSLNGKIDRVMISIAKGMQIKEFVEILPFDPRIAYEAEAAGENATALWATSYTLDVIRRSSSHDSLPFFKEHFFPSIQFCSRQAVHASEREELQDEFLRWSALLTQYWRIAGGFFHYPIEITDESFRDIAKQLVGLLKNPSFVDTSATAIHVLTDGYFLLTNAEDMTGLENEDGEEKLEDDLRESGPGKKSSKVEITGLEEDDVFLSFNDPGWNPHIYHNISKERAQIVCSTILAKYSANIMPSLCNIFETHNSMAVLLAIQSYSKVCKPEVMSGILSGILQVGSSIAADLQEKVEIYGGANQSIRKAGNIPLSSKRRMILDIACAIVPQLSAEDILRLFNDVIEPVLQDPTPDSRLLQKKAYKLLLSMFEHRVKDLHSFLPRIIGILSIGRQYVTISGMKMRLRCLSWTLDACKMFYPDSLLLTVRSTIGEIIAFAREQSSETRILTMDILEKMHRYLISSGSPPNTLLHMVVGGLAGKTSSMLSSTVVCMAKLVYLAHDSLPENDLERVVALGIKLMESSMPEVRSAASIFARMALKLSKRCSRVRTALQASLPKLLFSIALVTSQPRVSSNTRTEMRVLLEKIIKQFGYDVVDASFPIGSKNFLRYTDRMRRREDKKAERALKQRDQSKKNEFEQLFFNARMNMGGEDAPEMDLLEAGALNTFVSQHTAPAIPGLSRRQEEDNDEYDQFHMDIEDGKLRIRSTTEWQVELEKKRREQLTKELLRQRSGPLTRESLNEGASRPGKRSRDELEDFENQELILRHGGKGVKESSEKLMEKYTSDKKNAVGPGVNQLQKMWAQKEEKQALKKLRVEQDIKKGEEFAGTGLGDVKRGNVEPYAYVPLNRQFMNRRNARQSLHRFQVIDHKQLKGEKAKNAIRKDKQ